MRTTSSARPFCFACACHWPFRVEKNNADFRNSSLSYFPGWKWSPNLMLQTNNFCLSQIPVVWPVYENIFLPTVAAQQSELQRLIGFSDQMTGLTVDELLPQAAVSLAVLHFQFFEILKFQPIHLASSC